MVETSRERRLLGARRLVRLKFFESCPYDLFTAAIEGFSRHSHAPDTEAKRVEDQVWR